MKPALKVIRGDPDDVPVTRVEIGTMWTNTGLQGGCPGVRREGRVREYKGEGTLTQRVNESLVARLRDTLATRQA